MVPVNNFCAADVTVPLRKRIAHVREILSELTEDEKQKLIYVFDPLAERIFFIELSEIITGQDLEHAICSRKEGEAPQQTIDFDEQLNTSQSLDLGENFYGDEDYDMEDFDMDGFDMTEGNPYDDDKY